MRISKEGIDLIKKFEGFREDAYLCPAGVWTIGYGHTKGVKPEDKISPEQAEMYLRQDLSDSEESVSRLVTAPIEQCQFDALVSLVYNIGCGNFYSSTIRRLVNQGCIDKTKITHAFCMWKKSQGRVLSGLIRRREAESALYCKAESMNIKKRNF